MFLTNDWLVLFGSHKKALNKKIQFRLRSGWICGILNPKKPDFGTKLFETPIGWAQNKNKTVCQVPSFLIESINSLISNVFLTSILLLFFLLDTTRPPVNQPANHQTHPLSVNQIKTHPNYYKFGFAAQLDNIFYVFFLFFGCKVCWCFFIENKKKQLPSLLDHNTNIAIPMALLLLEKPSWMKRKFQSTEHTDT